MKEGKKLRIGVFDSGIGGLTVLRACMDVLPQAEYDYFGDNLRAPYGSRPRAEVLRFVREGLDLFAERGADAAVLACNTATAVCADVVRAEYPFPVIGTEPAVKPAAARCKTALLLATPLTAESARLRALIARFPQCAFTVYAPAGLAAAIERALPGGGEVDLFEHLPRGRYDGVVLGCTHYIFFAPEISTFYHAPVFDGNEGVARRLKEVVSNMLRAKIGTRDHSAPPTNPNDCLRISTKNGAVFFLGEGAKGNARLFSERLFEKNQK